jgi:hypothetical protein
LWDIITKLFFTRNKMTKKRQQKHKIYIAKSAEKDGKND